MTPCLPYRGLLLFLLLSLSACEIVADFDRDRITEANTKPPEDLPMIPSVPPEKVPTPLDAGVKDPGADDGGFVDLDAGSDAGSLDGGQAEDAGSDAGDASLSDAATDAGDAGDAGI